MGASDPLLAGYVIWFGSLEFRATGNGYLMELLSPRRNPDAPMSPARRNRRSGQSSARMERRRAARLSSPTWVEVGMSQLSVAADGATTSSSRAPAPFAPAPPSTAAPVHPREGATTPSPFPFGMHNAATYASSISTNFTEYEDLPGHHLLSIRNLIASSPDDSYNKTASSIADDISLFMDNFTAEEAEDYSGVRDPDALRSFQLVTAYCLTRSEDSSEGDYDPTRAGGWGGR